MPSAPIRTNESGRFEFWGLNDSGFRLVAVADAPRLRKLGLALPPDRSTAPLIWLAVGRPDGKKLVDLGDIGPGSLSIVDLRIVKWDNSPAAGATVLVKGGYGYRSPMRYRVDRAGRLLFPLPPGEFEIEAFMQGGGVAHVDHTVPRRKAVADPRAAVKRRISLSRPCEVKGVVVDANGKPVAGARVKPWNRPRDVDRKLADLAFETARGQTSHSDAKGNFRVLVPFADATYQIHAWAKMPDGSWHGASVWVAVSESGESDAVKLQIAKN